MASWTDATTRWRPSSSTRRSRYSSTSGKLWPVSMCITANGMRAGQNAFSATRSMTIESLPPEKSTTGRSNSAATSRKMWMASASRAWRWLSSYVSGAKVTLPPAVRSSGAEARTGALVVGSDLIGTAAVRARRRQTPTLRNLTPLRVRA
jgi:hypothetical protein